MEQYREPNKFVRILALVVFALMLIAFLPLLGRMFGFSFLPSLGWLETSSELAISTGIFCGSVSALVLYRRPMKDDSDGEWLKSRMLLAFGAPFFGWISMSSVTVGIPFVFTTAFGANGSHEFIVEQAEGFSDRKCQRKIELLDLPIVYNELCGFSVEFRNSLKPGMELIVSGRSSQFGVFVSEVQAVGE